MQENRSLKPWLSLWIHPRAAMRTILNTNPLKYIVPLVIANGIVSALSWIGFIVARYPQREGYQSVTFIGGLLFVGILLGLINLYFGGWLLKKTSHWLKGKGTYTETKCSIGWSAYLFLVAGIFAVFSYFLHNYPLPSTLFGLINVILSVWGSIAAIFLLAEAQQFSFFRALCAIIIALVLVFVVIMLVSIVVSLIASFVV